MLQARKGEADTTPDDILSMVKAQAQPPHRSVAVMREQAASVSCMNTSSSDDKWLW